MATMWRRVVEWLSHWRQNPPNFTNKRFVLRLGLVAVLAYGAMFVVPKQVQFSYGSTTCSGTLTLLPGLHQAVDASRFRLEYRGGLSIAGAQLTATRICFIPVQVPQRGVTSVASALFGMPVLALHYHLVAGEAPHVLANQTVAQSIGRPLNLKLSQTDNLFAYQVEINGQSQPCLKTATALSCGIDKLGLNQGATYALKLHRSFDGKTTGDATAVQLALLPSTKVASTSIKPDELVYTKPPGVDITLDKPVGQASASVELIDGDKPQPIVSQLTTAGAVVHVTWPQELPREKTFRVTLTAAAATDGSSLDVPYSFGFRTSGGPKVAAVSVGGSGVAADARVVVTFDQPLAANTNVTTFASITGGSATISRQGMSQVVFALHDMPRCGAFTLAIGRGLVGENGVVAHDGWSQSSRISCRLTRTIGYSLKGRPIQAYFYGTGAKTILFTGGIHGNEPSGTYIMQDWATYLDNNGYKIPADRQVVVVPNLNPDGIASNQRYNARNVNIDRNFPTSDWIRDITAAGGVVVPNGGGVTPLSEPETQAIVGLTSSLQVRAEISFHSSGALVGANKVADSVAIGNAYAAAVHYGTVFYNPEETFGYTLTGEYETWMGEKYGIPAILIELPTSNGRFFSRHQTELWNMVNL